MTIIYVVRHGETDYNIEDRYLGRTDVPLNSTGRKQAKELAKKVQKLNIDLVISSPLKRTLETVQVVFPDKEIIKDYHFIERSTGVYEGLTKQEAQNKFPELYRRNITRIFDEAPPKGETIRQVQLRVFEGLDELKQKYQNKIILIVTHAFIAKVINKYFYQNQSDDDFFNFILPLAGVKKYTIS